MKTSDMRAKARAIFGPAIAEPMPKQPNGAKALQQRANARPIPTYKVGGVVKKPMPTPAASAASGNRMAREEADEMRFMEAMEPKQNRQSMPMRSGKPPVYGVGKPAFPNSAASAASANRIAKQEADEKKLMDAMRGRDEGPRKPVTLKEKPVQVDLDEKRKKVRLNEKRVPVTLDEKRVRVDKMEYKTGGKAGKYDRGGVVTIKPMGERTAGHGRKLLGAIERGEMTNAQAQAAQNAFVKQEMARQTAADAKASMAKPMGQVTADFGAGLRNQINTGKMTTAQAQATQNNFVRDQMAMRTAAAKGPMPAVAPPTDARPMGERTAAYGASLRDQVKAGTMTNAQAQAAQNAFVKQQMSPANAATLQSTMAQAAVPPLQRAKGGKVQTSSDTARKLASEMGGMKKGGKAGKYADGGMAEEILVQGRRPQNIDFDMSRMQGTSGGRMGPPAPSSGGGGGRGAAPMMEEPAPPPRSGIRLGTTNRFTGATADVGKGQMTAGFGPSVGGSRRVGIGYLQPFKKGGKVKEPKPKNGLAVMIAIGKPMKPAKKMNGGPMAERSTDMESSKVTRNMAMGGDPMGYAAGGAGKTRKGQAPIKKAQGGAAKVRKGMMTPEGDIINVMNKMRGK